MAPNSLLRVLSHGGGKKLAEIAGQERAQVEVHLGVLPDLCILVHVKEGEHCKSQSPAGSQ